MWCPTLGRSGLMVICLCCLVLEAWVLRVRGLGATLEGEGGGGGVACLRPPPLLSDSFQVGVHGFLLSSSIHLSTLPGSRTFSSSGECPLSSKSRWPAEYRPGQQGLWCTGQGRPHSTAQPVGWEQKQLLETGPFRRLLLNQFRSNDLDVSEPTLSSLRLKFHYTLTSFTAPHRRRHRQINHTLWFCISNVSSCVFWRTTLCLHHLRFVISMTAATCSPPTRVCTHLYWVLFVAVPQQRLPGWVEAAAQWRWLVMVIVCSPFAT